MADHAHTPDAHRACTGLILCACRIVLACLRPVFPLQDGAAEKAVFFVRPSNVGDGETDGASDVQRAFTAASAVSVDALRSGGGYVSDGR